MSSAERESLAAVARAIVEWLETTARRPLSGRDVAQRTHINPSTWHNIAARGFIPSLDVAIRVAAGAALPRELRQRWFAACGYPDPREGELVYEAVLEAETLQALRGAERLSAEDLAELNRLLREEIAERQKRRGVS